MLLLTAAPIPKTIEDLGQEVTEDVLLARLEQQRALQVGHSLFLVGAALLSFRRVASCCAWLAHHTTPPASCRKQPSGPTRLTASWWDSPSPHPAPAKAQTMVRCRAASITSSTEQQRLCKGTACAPHALRCLPHHMRACLTTACLLQMMT